MAQSLRNLQIFRNGELLTGSVAYVKGLINIAFSDGTIVLKDGEPISIRYKETNESTEIKSLFGVAYVNGDNKSILWNESGITIDTDPKNNAYVTLNHDIDEATGNYTLTVGAQIAETIDGDGLATASVVKNYVENKLEAFSPDAITAVNGEDETDSDYVKINAETTEGVVNLSTTVTTAETIDGNGLATASLVKSYVEDKLTEIEIPTVPEYTIKALETTTDGYLKSYQLFKGDVPVDDAVIDIPKDYLVKSASIKTVEEENNPEEGYKIGDKYFDFVINTNDGNGTETHLYINAKDLVDTYEGGNGISIDENNRISVKITENEEYIVSDTTGIHTTEALKTAIESAGETYTKGDDIDITDDNKINVSLSNAITPNTTVGFVDANTTIEAGSSLEDILRKILVKEVLATSVKPTNSLSVSGELQREVGTALGEITLNPSYTDGYYKSSDEKVYTTIQFNTNNPDAINGKLNAGCESGAVTYYKGTSEITDAVNETKGFQYVDNTQVITNTTYDFYIQTAYQASTVNECKTSSDAIQSISIPSGTTEKSSETSVKFYHKTYISSIEGLVWDAANGYLVKNGVEYDPSVELKNTMSEEGAFLTSKEQNNSETYTIPGTSSLCVIVPQNVIFSTYSASDPSKTDLFVNFKKYETTNRLDINYDIYIYTNNGNGEFALTGLTYSSIVNN